MFVCRVNHGVVNPQRSADEVSLTSRGPVVAASTLMLRAIFGIMLMIAILGMLRAPFRAAEECEYDATSLFESNETLSPMMF